jgi:tyrosyl-tRNA synthetase
VVVIVGDYTGMVGDPSGRSKTRPQLTADRIEEYARTYLDQFFRVVDRSKTEIHKNGEWFASMSFADILRLASKYTVARLLERDDFAKRWQAAQPISVHELLYPLMQGHDSVEIRADVEIGGTEQKFNLLVGRVLQEADGQEPQAILTLPILVGLDGEQRMSKSLGNYVGIAEPPSEQFGKLMSIPDEQIVPYFRLATDLPLEEVEAVAKDLAAGTNPMTHKKALAERIVGMYHGAEAGAAARASFESQFVKRGRPLEAVLWTLAGPGPWPVRQVLVDTGLAKTLSDARRKIEEGAVELDGQVVKDPRAKSLRQAPAPRSHCGSDGAGCRWPPARPEARPRRARRRYLSPRPNAFRTAVASSSFGPQCDARARRLRGARRIPGRDREHRLHPEVGRRRPGHPVVDPVQGIRLANCPCA